MWSRSRCIIDVNKVLILDEVTGLLEEKTFEPGIASWRWTEVLSGLREGQHIVVSLDREGVVPGLSARAEDSARSAR